MDERHDTLFDEEESEKPELAHVDFDLLDTTGRWFLKVLSGPNTGAEFSMQSGTSYLVGTDAATCDIVFQDLSVSRQHARINIDAQDNVAVEDLNSRNGTFVDGEKLSGRKAITTNALVSMGTTTFMLVDREGERQTIVSPVLSGTGEKKEEIKPDQVPTKTPGEELGPIPEAVLAPMQSEVERIKEEEKKEARISHAISALVVLASITGLLVIVGVGTTFLFKTQEVPQEHSANADTIISKALKDYPGIRYSFNPTTGRLLLIGHVLTPVDRNKILETLQDMKFITQLDATNVVIDELVWREINQVISKNPAWRSVSITSPVAGKFVLSGFLKSRKQAEDLYDYVSQNFQYVDLLEKKVIVEEDLKTQIQQKLNEAGFRTLQVSLNNGDLTISGSITNGTLPQYNAALAQIKALAGIRGVQSLVSEVAPEQTLVNITDRYPVSGHSLQGNNINVVINGRILTKGDIIDGMTITEIQPTAVFLEKDGIRYRIDFNR
ncbi:MAG: type III secretion system inner membrane ring subunit SctD [Verrucomicrobia bacterium]|nr:type III secretion system inner membrane ring subunit SctD [Verrucomicrobiota bacterium]